MTAETQYLWHALKPYRLLFVFVILLSVCASGLDGISIGLLVPLLSDLQGAGHPAVLPHVFLGLLRKLHSYPVSEQIFLSLGLIALTVTLKDIFVALSIGLGHWLSSRLVGEMQEQAVALLLTVGLEFHHQSRIADLFERTLNSPVFVEYLIRTALEFIANALTFLALVIVLFLVSWPLALLGAAMAGFLLLLSRRFTFDTGQSARDLAAADRAMADALYETLGGIQLIKGSGKEAQQIRRLTQAIHTARTASCRRNFQVFSVHPLTDMLATWVFALLVGTALTLAHRNAGALLTQLLPFLFAVLRLVPLVKILNGQRVDLISRWPYVALIYDLVRRDGKPFLADGADEFPGLQREIRFDAVTLSYPGTLKPALQDISFTVPAGETTAVVGESGAGKSSIVHLLLRAYDPQEGRLLLDGRPLTAFRTTTYHHRVGVVSQDPFLFNETIRFNIAFSADETPSEERLLDASRRAAAHDFIMELPNGYDTVVGDRGVQLSGGQRQRISIARAILKNPEILILDEATSALDLGTERLVLEAIRELSRDRTVIVIAHRLSAIENAHQVVTLDQGRVVKITRNKPLLT